MGIGILIGAIAGIIGFLPLFAALRLSLRSTASGSLGVLGFSFGGVFASLVVLVVELIACAVVARAFVLPFGLAEMCALVVSTACYAIYKSGLFASQRQ